MKSKDYFVLKKIIEYCNQVDEAVNMFGNDFDCFAKNSVYRNACCMCILQIGELCKLVSTDIRNEYKTMLSTRNIPNTNYCIVEYYDCEPYQCNCIVSNSAVENGSCPTAYSFQEPNKCCQTCYKTCKKVTWSDWSEWDQKKVLPTTTMEVETKIEDSSN